MASVGSSNAPFDYCVVTASSPAQAELYRSLVSRRTACGMYPSGLKFRFYADPPKGRVGSGGGTLVALSELFREEVGRTAFSGHEGAADEAALQGFFRERRVLVLHAGGESRRLPCYVPEGKLFGPISVPSGAKAECPPVVLDLVLALYFKYPWVPGEVILASGDVIADFDTSAFSHAGVPFERGAICGFGKAASLEQGSRHGVFAFAPSQDEAGREAVTLAVSDFHQKASVAVLAAECLVPGTSDQCALDMGIFSMNVEWCLAFFQMAGSPYAASSSTAPATVMAAVEDSKLYFDFYLEVVIASLPNQSKESYLARMANSSELPVSVLESIYNSMQGLELRGALVSDAVFLHFGTLREFPQASAEARRRSMVPFYAAASPEAIVDIAAPSASEVLLLNCSPGSVKVEREERQDAKTEDAWVEMCSGLDVTVSAAGFHMLVGLHDVLLPRPIPAGICLDSRRGEGLAPGIEGKVVAVYSVTDTFKRTKAPEAVVFCGMPLSDWLSLRGLEAKDIWEDPSEAQQQTDLWTARLFCEYRGSAEILEGYWNEAVFSREAFLSAPRFSIDQLNRNDSVLERDGLRSKFFLETLVESGR